MADDRALSPAEMADRSALIVIGSYLGATTVRTTAETVPMHLGIIHVTTVLKGETATTVAVLRLPPSRPGGLRASTDVPLAIGQQGLWYLRRVAEGLYDVDRPDRFVPIQQAEARIRALRGD